MAEIQLNGMDELLQRLQEMGRVGKQVQDKALLLGAQPILEDAITTHAFNDRTGKGRIGLAIARPKSKGDKRYVLIGIDKADFSEIFYMKMIEFGTTKMPARPFLAPAFYRQRFEAFKIIKAEVRRELGL